MTRSGEASLRVVQVSVFVDPQGRDPDALLEAWPALQVMARAVVLAGNEVHVVQAAAADAERTRDGVSYHFVGEKRLSSLRLRLGRTWAPLTPRVFDRVADLSPDVVHFHGLSLPRHLATLAKRLPGVPILAQDHADRPAPSWRRGIQRRGLAQATGVAFTARAQAEPWVRAGALAPDAPVFEVTESTSAFRPGETSLRLDGDPCFLWIGRLDPNKDPLTVLEAFSRAVTSLPAARLWMCYRDAPLLDQVRARIAGDERLAARVVLLGSRPHDRIEQLLRAADFLVLGSHREGSGYSVIEALACGCTPLVTDIPSLRRITGAGAVGALFPPGDAAALAAAMVDSAARDRSTLRHAAREHFDSRLSLDAIGRELKTAYEGVMQRSAARGRGVGV